MPEVADCGNGILIASAAGCNLEKRPIRRIHIWRGPSNPNTDGGCELLQYDSGNDLDLCLQYGDGESLKTLDLYKIWAFAQKPGKLFIHCAAGRCRSPTLGVFAMMARGCVPWHAIHDITAALWQQRRTTPHWCPIPLAELFSWWETNRW